MFSEIFSFFVGQTVLIFTVSLGIIELLTPGMFFTEI